MIIQVNLVLMRQCDIRKKDGEKCLDGVKRDNINPDWLIGCLVHQCCGVANRLQSPHFLQQQIESKKICTLKEINQQAHLLVKNPLIESLPKLRR